jgi:hypothetical protein
MEMPVVTVFQLAFRVYLSATAIASQSNVNPILLKPALFPVQYIGNSHFNRLALAN